MLNRRQFLRAAGAAGLALGMRRMAKGANGDSPGTPPLTPFVDDITGVLPPILTGVRQSGVDYYNVAMRQATHRFHQSLAPSPYWGYVDYTGGVAGTQGYLGGIIIAEKGVPVKINFTNILPTTHVLQNDNGVPVIDKSIVGMPGGSVTPIQNAAAIHLHGGLMPWQSDGHPLSWFGNNSGSTVPPHGPYFDPNRQQSDPAYTGLVGRYFTYPNDQSARFMWYHDHAVGLTRLNAYAGLATGYIVRDTVESNMIGSGAIPSREMFLILQDKAFSDDGRQWYPDTYVGPEPGTWEPLPFPSCVPEMFGDVHTVNGFVQPKMKVQRKRYRVRMLNGSQSRFYRMKLYAATGTDGSFNTSAPGPAFNVFGTEGGFMPTTVVYNNPNLANSPKLLMAPAERYDMIIDFSACGNETDWILTNDAPSPFPSGTFPCYEGNALREGAVMMFHVEGSTPETTGTTRVPTPAELWPSTSPFTRLAEASKNASFLYTLNEGADKYGRLIQMIGTTTPGEEETPFGVSFLNPSGTDAVKREEHKRNDVEVWSIVNLSADTHPMHFHLINVQVMSRQPLDVNNFISTKQIRALGAAIPAEPVERGWKETVRCPPGQVTKIITKIEAPPEWVANQTPHYVWHCHILEHEEHDMMRQFDIKA